MTRWISTLLPFLLATLLVMGCKGRKVTGDTPRYKGMTQPEVLEKHRESRLQFRTLSLKGKAEFDNPAKKESGSFSYKICVAKDSLIWASISKLGLPGATLLIDHDSVRMKMPLTKEAVICDYNFFSRMAGLDVDFALLQDFITGDGPSPDSATLVTSTEPPIELRGNRPPYQLSWFLNTSHFKLEKMVVKDRILGAESTLAFGEFQKVGGQQVPTHMRLDVTAPSELRIELKHSDIKIDSDDVTFAFRIPEGYQINPCERK